MSTVNQKKQTERFEERIRQFLTQQGEKDPLFLQHCCEVSKTLNKNTADCCTYIINEVQKSGRCGFDDEEIYSLAMHYWDEDNITNVGNRPSCQIVLNQEVQLSEEEIEECKREAKERLIKQQMDAMRPGKSKPTMVKKETTPTLSLFDEAETPETSIEEEWNRHEELSF